MEPLDEVQGKVKEMVGSAIGDDELHEDGKEQKAVATAQREAKEARVAAGEDEGGQDVFERLDRDRDGL